MTYAAHIVTAADQLGDPAIVVMTQADETGAADAIVEIDLPAGCDPYELLVEHAWRLVGEPTHEPYTIVDVEPADWPGLVSAVTHARAQARAEFDRQDLAWRRVIGDAMRTEGVPRTAVAAAAEVTEARLYQIREGRR